MTPSYWESTVRAKAFGIWAFVIRPWAFVISSGTGSGTRTCTGNALKSHLRDWANKTPWALETVARPEHQGLSFFSSPSPGSLTWVKPRPPQAGHSEPFSSFPFLLQVEQGTHWGARERRFPQTLQRVSPS